MKKTTISIITVSAVMLIVLACQINLSPVDQNAIATAAEQTIVAKQPTLAPIPPTATPQPTQADTPVPSPTPKPCNKAEFISETIPDNSEFNPNEEFTKTWRLKNIGTCTWNTNYRVVLQSGDAMGMDSAQYFTQTIGPGEQMDVVLELKAPSDDGKYTTWFQLKDNEGKKFAQVYVMIEVK